MFCEQAKVGVVTTARPRAPYLGLPRCRLAMAAKTELRNAGPAEPQTHQIRSLARFGPIA
jgi:hypothetical protein